MGNRHQDIRVSTFRLPASASSLLVCATIARSRRHACVLLYCYHADAHSDDFEA